MQAIEGGAMTVTDQATGKLFRDIWEAIEPNPVEALNLQMRSDLMRAVDRRVKDWKLTQKEAAKRLGITQPRLSLLLSGDINAFSLDALVKVATAAGIEINLEFKDAA
jgi:predicted XRE-type DNA-binding protein